MQDLPNVDLKRYYSCMLLEHSAISMKDKIIIIIIIIIINVVSLQ